MGFLRAPPGEGFARGGFFWKKKRWKLRTGEGGVEMEVPGGEKEKKWKVGGRDGETKRLGLNFSRSEYHSSDRKGAWMGMQVWLWLMVGDGRGVGKGD